MKTLQGWFVVLVMVGVVAVGFRESHGADPMPGVIAQDEGDPQRDATAEEPAVVPLTVNRTGPEPPPAVAPCDAEQARAHQEAWAEHLGLPVEWTNSIGMKFVLIPPGHFAMGSPRNDSRANPNETPQRQVRITQAFYLSTCEVNQQHYEHVTGENPSRFKQPQHPVEYVSWDDAVSFCVKLLTLPEEKPLGVTYHLPTEAQWEYACRAGTTSWQYRRSDDGSLADVVHAQLARERGEPQYGLFGRRDPDVETTAPVGRLQPNAWGLHDMLGNVWEWCEDWYVHQHSLGDAGDDDPEMETARLVDDPEEETSGSIVLAIPRKSPRVRIQVAIDNPKGPSTGWARVIRGGGWYDYSWRCRASCREGAPPDARIHSLGFRVAAVPSGE